MESLELYEKLRRTTAITDEEINWLKNKIKIQENNKWDLPLGDLKSDIKYIKSPNPEKIIEE